MSAFFYIKAITEPVARAMLAAIESTLPTRPLEYRIDPTGSIHLVADPGAWSASHLAGDAPAIICNGAEEAYVSLTAIPIPPDTVGGESVVQMCVELPWIPAFIERVPNLLRAFGIASNAYWGICSPRDADVAIVKGAGRMSSNPGFPRSVSPSVAIPGRLAWINYWSNEACRWLGFSPDDKRASLFARVTAIEGRGVLLHLTEDILDLDRPEHLAALTAAFAAFPAIDEKWGF